MALTVDQLRAVSNLIEEANSYTGDNVYQDVFYQYPDIVDIDATADAENSPNIVFLTCGEVLVWDEQTKRWR